MSSSRTAPALARHHENPGTKRTWVCALRANTRACASCWHGQLLGLVLLLAGCRPPADATDAAPPTLLLYCGAGIRPPVAELAEAFGSRQGVKLECDYAGSEVLLGRIKLTGQGDLYMPGDLYYVEQAEAEGLLAEKTSVCYLVPVILVQRGNPKGIHTLPDLLRAGVKVGLGDAQACAIGRNCEQLFERAGISPQTLADHVAFRSLTVNELGIDVAMGALDAAIVWDAVAASYADKTEVVAIPAEQNVLSTVAVGVLHASARPELARKFVAFLTTPEARAIFARHHYTTALPESPAHESAARAAPGGGML
jgi:molybdate transport system substrate-binding protein